MSDHKSLAAALVAALADLSVVETNRTAKIPTKTGGEYSYKYADIADVVKLTRPVLAKHGVVALTPVHDHGDGLACTVTFLHSSGDRLDFGPFPFPHGKDAQATGSMVTYHRRYALVAALGIAAGDDDDGASAAPRPSKFPGREPNETRPARPLNESGTPVGSGKLSDDQIVLVQAWLDGDPSRRATLKSQFGTMQPARIEAARWSELAAVIGAGEVDPPGGQTVPPTVVSPAPSFSKDEERPF